MLQGGTSCCQMCVPKQFYAELIGYASCELRQGAVAIFILSWDSVFFLF